MDVKVILEGGITLLIQYRQSGRPEKYAIFTECFRKFSKEKTKYKSYQYIRCKAVPNGDANIVH